MDAKERDSEWIFLRPDTVCGPKQGTMGGRPVIADSLDAETAMLIVDAVNAYRLSPPAPAAVEREWPDCDKVREFASAWQRLRSLSEFAQSNCEYAIFVLEDDTARSGVKAAAIDILSDALFPCAVTPAADASS